MRSFTKLSVTAGFGLALAACGGGTGAQLSKESAAALLFDTAQTSNKANQGGRLGAGIGISQSVDCDLGGSMELAVDAGSLGSLGGDEATVAIVTTFRGCATEYDNPETSAVETEKMVLDGTLTFSMKTDTDFDNTDTANFEMVVKSDLNASGAVSDFIKSDVTYTFGAVGLDSANAQVTFTIDGSIETRAGKHAYAKQTISLTENGFGDDTDVGGDLDGSGDESEG